MSEIDLLTPGYDDDDLVPPERDDSLLPPGDYTVALTDSLKIKVDKNQNPYMTAFFKLIEGPEGQNLKNHKGVAGNFYINATITKKDGTTFNKGHEFAKFLLALGVPKEDVQARSVSPAAIGEADEYGARKAAIMRNGEDITPLLVNKPVVARLEENTFKGVTRNRVKFLKIAKTQ